MKTAARTLLTEYVACDLCGSLEHTLLFSKIDQVTGLEFNLVECSCGMAFVNPMPTRECISMIYPDDYLDGKERRQDKYAKMLSLLPSASGQILLDIGCGRGDFIHYAAASGWQTEGVDLMDWRSPYSDAIKVGDFLTMDLPEAGYDAVTAWALLEHVRQPSLYFRKASRLLRDNGRFVFVVPNISAPGMRYSCSEDIPRHLWLFTPAAVMRYLDESGMEAVSIRHDGRIYQAYPFGLLRRLFNANERKEPRCREFENRAVALLRNRQVKGNLRPWLAEALRSLGPKDLVIDALDLALGVLVAQASKIVRNYGVINVIARKRTAAG
jgi:SAM-dependent methyltransferase